MTETTAPREPRGKTWQILAGYTEGRVRRLQRAYLRGDSRAKADLAALRNCDPTRDESLLLAWDTVFLDAPEELIGTRDIPSRSERATAAALHLYGMHQQSKQEPMHAHGKGLGIAIRRLANPSDEQSREQPVMRRFHSLNTATEFAEIMHHLRGLVKQFRAGSIPLDYAKLATDLYFLSSPESRTKVRLAWARDLSRKPKPEADDESATAPTPSA